MKLLSQIPHEVASKHDTNLASVVEVAVNVYFTLLQDTTPRASMNIYPEVDFLESMQLAKLASG